MKTENQTGKEGSFSRLAKLLFLCALLLALPARTADARFLSPDSWDPWLQGVDINRYAYSGNDPINGSDPNGHESLTLGYENYRESGSFAQQMRRYQNGIVDGAVINAMLRAGLIDFNEAVKLQNAVANPSQSQEEAEGRPKKGATIGSDGKVIDKDGKPISGSEGGPGAGKRFKT